MTGTWFEQFKHDLHAKYAADKAEALFAKYAQIFPENYLAETANSELLADVDHLELLSATNAIEVYFYEDAEHLWHLRVYQSSKPKSLSAFLPILENLNLTIDSENLYHLNPLPTQTVWISDFVLLDIAADNALRANTEIFKVALEKIYVGLAEDDGLNKLILTAAMNWHEVMVLRSLTKYLRQIGFRFSQSYIEKALLANVHLTKLLVQLFIDLQQKPAPSLKNSSLEPEILQALEQVVSLDEDRIIRQLLALVKAIVRCNYFQIIQNYSATSYLAIKFASGLIPEIPLPIPLYEIFVYSPRFEGIHLRASKVARGGIRYSDRPEDFRTEILGLMKAQTVKNAIIVPSGAKGGFVLKSETSKFTPQELKQEVINCYTGFISGLLDLTDNIKAGKIVHPKDIVCHDDADPYLVVAADKGTAQFSDLANSIAAKYDFWLGDAFASGGSEGYDHKKMGITARGAWESVKRHFQELNVDVLTQPITVVGIGDMSGDVFGNGMLYTNTIKLVAAFDHRHIFIDPDPDPLISYNERARLFNLPTSSWADYNPKLISSGGGVFNRKDKAIHLTPEMQAILNTTANTLTPNELIRTILIAPVDLLYNGGIGTYVKASTESNSAVGDRSNDYTRVNGAELRCRVVCEGGNLGFTQPGRIEYAQGGGLINTDFIDNSAGVDCSDHEVNLKILLDSQVAKNKLNKTERNKLLAALTDEVAELVLADNYKQALIMSYSAYRAKHNLDLHIEYINELAKSPLFNRSLEFIPNAKELLERKAQAQSLTRPELAVLLAHTKILVKAEILKTNNSADDYLSEATLSAFPASIRAQYRHEILNHPLARDISATQLSNQIINQMGITFIYRIQAETGAAINDIIRAQTIASRVFATQQLQEIIENLHLKIPLKERYDMLFSLKSLINLATRWFLHHHKTMHSDLHSLTSYFADQIKRLEELVPKLMSGATQDYHTALTTKFTATGLPPDVARRIATYRAIYSSLNIVDVSQQHQYDLERTARIYFMSGEKMSLVWFRDQINKDAREGHWNTLARLTLRDQLDTTQRALTVAILNSGIDAEPAESLLSRWIAAKQCAFDHWQRILNMLYESTTVDYTMFFIALRELHTIIGPAG
jgi:glutamate dehydrogenase